LKRFLSLFTGNKKSPIGFNAPTARIGEYSVVRKIGSGATSNVYLAIHEKTLVSAAIKVLRRECHSDVHKQMFATEAALCGRLDHPNIISIHHADLGAEEGAYLVLEYVKGESMDKYRKPETLLSIDAVVDAIEQSAQALKYASAQGIVHRDVKPDNLMRTAEGRVKLSDFGCAVVGDLEARPLVIAGSVGYMSPEQLTGRPLSFRSDIYALGTVFYRLLTGRYTFDADTPDEAARTILRNPPVPVEARRKGVPRELTELIARALQKQPEDRHSSWDEFIGEIGLARQALRTKYDYDYDMLRGFSENTLSQYLADTRELAVRRELAARAGIDEKNPSGG
jgi:serine/threonine protein kinase